MKAIRVERAAADAAALELRLVEQPRPRPAAGQCLVEVRSAGVNPSDAKAALGRMPHAAWPRTPGRDFAGVVAEGPPALLGRRVWGCGGDLGIRRDGSHAGWLLVDAASVREIPPGVGMREAGAVGVPFVTAWEGLRRASLPGAGEVVLVMGANGACGQATMQIAAHLGARAIGVVRSERALAACATAGDALIDASREDVVERVRALTGGRGADLVYNTVGSPYFDAANRSMAVGGRQVFISTLEREVPFDIFSFYRGQHTYVGVDSLALDATACAAILERLAPGFESGALRPFGVADDAVFGLDRAFEAYRRVLAGATGRIVLEP